MFLTLSSFLTLSCICLWLSFHVGIRITCKVYFTLLMLKYRYQHGLDSERKLYIVIKLFSIYICLCTYLLSCFLAFLLSCFLAFLLSCFLAFLLSCFLAFLLSCLLTYLPICLFIYLFVCLFVCLFIDSW